MQKALCLNRTFCAELKFGKILIFCYEIKTLIFSIVLEIQCVDNNGCNNNNDFPVHKVKDDGKDNSDKMTTPCDNNQNDTINSPNV